MQSELINRLQSLRRTVRRRLLVYGLCAVSAGGAVSFLTIVTIDWLLWLPAALRIVIGLFFLAGFVGAVMHWIVAPTRAKLGIDEIAGKLEQHFGNLHDRLTSTVNFLQGADAGSPAMMRQVVINTDRVLHGLTFDNALTARPMVRSVACFVGAFAVLGFIVWGTPDWPQTGLYRYVHPFGAIEWPRDVSIEPLTGDEVVPFGESFTVRMKITRGLTEELRGVVTIEEPDGHATALAMTRDQDGAFYATVDSVTADLRYWFEAGDDSTEGDKFTLRAIRRPEVVDAVVSIAPPSYAGPLPPRVQALRDGPIAAPLAATVSLSVEFSKPIATDRPMGLRFEDGELVPGRIIGDDRRTLAAGFEVNGDARFAILATDEDGLINRSGDLYTVRLTPDVPPSVTLVEPRSMVELTPKGSLRLVVRVEDDLGVTGAELRSKRSEQQEMRSAVITDSFIGAPSAPGEPVTAVADYDWSIAALSLSPGDVVQYHVLARDNYSLDGGGGQVGMSAPMRIKIISEVEFDVRIRDDLAMLETRIRQATLDQTELVDQVVKLIRREEPPTPLSGEEREQGVSSASQQVRLQRRIAELAEKFRDLGRRMALNNAGDEETRQQAATAAEALEKLAAGAMNTAALKLDDAVDQTDAPAQQERLADGVKAQQDAIDGLQSLVRSMAQWGDYQGIVTRTRDVHDRQKAIRARTAEIGKTAVGKAVDELSPSEAADLVRTRRQQEQLAEDVEQLLARVKQLADRISEKDPAGAASLEAAVRAANAGEVTKKQKSAVEALSQNRTAAATVAQNGAEEAMRSMVAALREREKRELALLKKRVEQAEEQITLLIAHQDDLKKATDEAGRMGADEAVFDDLGQQQGQLHGNTHALGEELSDVENAGDAARLVRQAADPMGDARDSLAERQAEQAVVAQDGALELLRQALADIQRLAAETNEEVLRRTLADIREELESVLEMQTEVNGELASLKADVDAKGQVTRAEARRATTLARSEAEAIDRIDAVKPELAKVPVYDWALKRVVGWMGMSRDSFEQRKIDADLVSTTDRIAREIERLIGAIKDTESTQLSDEFVQEDDGGGGSGSASQQAPGRPIPAITELMVLRAMQADINERTRALGEGFDPDHATEAQLRDLRIVGEDQAEVRKLTDMVTQQARKPG